MKKKALVVFSGGQDSTTCLYWARHYGYDVHTLTIHYGQLHACEIEAARIICDRAGVEESKRFSITLPEGVLASTSPLVSGEQLEMYKDYTALPNTGVEKTFVPNRNQLFLTLAANRAVAIGAETIITGVCEEDFGGYPDCRRVFIDAIETACNLSNEGVGAPINIWTPLMQSSKAATVRMAWDIPECYAALAWSHTAYDGKFPPEGHDHASLLRAKGFVEAGLPDPLVLRAVHEELMDLPDTPNYDQSLLIKVMPVLERDNWLGAK